MGRTGPDWSSYGRLERMLAQYDIAELAARLSGYMTPHREGKWLFRDGFEGGATNWESTVSGDNSATIASVAYSRVGGVSFELLAGDAVGDYAMVQKRLPFPYDGHCGFEVAWAGSGVNMKVSMKVVHYTGTVLRRYGVRMSVLHNTLESLKYDNTWEAWQSGVYIENYPTAWNICKLVIDFDSHNYERFLLNGVEYAITTEQDSIASAGVAPMIHLRVRNETEMADDAYLYLDEVIATENERGWT